ncbi:MAG: choice-of-anchor D domain-containing protein [Terriglobales bacterium]|jgi:hypothetical protein
MKNLNARFALLLKIFRSLSSIACASATLTLIAPATLVAQTSASLVTSHIIQPIEENARITLKGNVRQDLATAPDLGSVEDAKPLHLYLLLQRTTAQEADLDNLIARQQQATAPEYHKWLTPKEFGARFGASPEDIAKVTAWLQSHGFKIRSVLNNASMIDFAATAGQVRDTFHTELHYFNIRGGKYLANVKDPQIPAALAPVVAGIKGLSKIPPLTNHTKIRQSSYDADTHSWHPVDPTAADLASPAYNAGGGYYLVTPQDFYTIYNVNPVFTAGNLAATATVAVIEESDIEYGTVNSTTGVATGGDVATFRTLFGVPGTLNMHVYHGYGTVTCNDPGIDPDDIGEDTEASLDAEWINATAPSADLIFMSCDQSPDNGIFSSIAALIDNNVSDVMSLSYGESELYFTIADYSFQDTLYAQAATQGQSFFVSSGDSGSDVADQNTGGTATSGVNVSAFAAPTVTVAGGTDFSDLYDSLEGGPAQSTYWAATNSTHYGDAISYVPETAWSNSCASSILANLVGGFTGAGYCATLTGGEVDGSVVGGSGGISTHYLVPAWQTGISGYSGTHHAQPDIAGFAANGIWGHYLIFCDSNPPDASSSGCTSDANFGGAGGTSFVAPYMAGVAGLLVDATGSRQGLLNPALYALAKAQYTAAATKTACYSNGQTSNTGITTGLPAADCIFDDVTTGDNDVPCAAGSTGCFVNTGDTYGMLSLKGASSLSVAYPSTIGFDQVAGIGTVNVHNLITKWNTAFTSTTGLKASPTSITSSQSTELTATVTGGTPTGYVDTPPALTGKTSFAAGSTSLGNCTLSAGTCSLSVPGTALQSGANSVTATFVGSGTYPTSTSSVVTVTVTASSVPVVSLTPTTLTFLITRLGSTSAVKMVTLKNTGNATLDINTGGITIGGADASSFSIKATTCGATLAASASCTISVTFSPAAIGALTGSLKIADNASGSPQSVPLNGTGTEVSLSPNPLAFGTVAMSKTLAVTVKNLGTTALTLTSTSITGSEAAEFSVLPYKASPATSTCLNPALTSLAQNATCTYSVEFDNAGVIESATANLNIFDNGGGGSQVLPLSGTGTEVSLSPNPLAFGTVTASKTLAVTVKNVGTTALTFSSSPTITGTGAAKFSVLAYSASPATSTCLNPALTPLAQNASCTYSVEFDNADAIGAVTATLNIFDNGGGSPQKEALSGTGTEVSLSPATLAFGTVTASKTLVLTVENVGTTALTFSSSPTITGTGAAKFSVLAYSASPATSTCLNPALTSLAQNASCTYSVEFNNADAIGPVTATLNIFDNGGGSPQKEALSGTGTEVSSTPATPAFGTVATTSTLAVTVENLGTTALTFSETPTVTGTGAANFKVLPYSAPSTSTCRNPALTSLAQNASCTFSVEFTNAGGTTSFTTTLNIFDNGGGSPQLKTMTATD